MCRDGGNYLKNQAPPSSVMSIDDVITRPSTPETTIP